MTSLGEITLEKTQAKIYEKMVEFIYDAGKVPESGRGRDRKYTELRIGGSAGTGKSLLIQKLLYEHRNNFKYAVVALAARAASRIGNGLEFEINNSTIHRLFYRVNNSGKRGIEFVVKPYQELKNLDFLICDEASQIDRKMYDLFSKHFKVPTIFVGDYAQLYPPAKVRRNEEPFTLMNPDRLDGKLVKIHRQAEGSGIIAAAHLVNKGSMMTPGLKYGDEYERLRCTSRTQLYDLFKNADMMLCGYNATKPIINRTARIARGMVAPGTTDRIVPGELICINMNNYYWEFYNGQVYRVLKIHTKQEFTYLVDLEFFDVPEPRPVFEKVPVVVIPKIEIQKSSDQFARLHPKLTEFVGNILSNQPTRQSTILCDYGYVLNLYEAQGSEWKRCVFFDDGFPPRSVANHEMMRQRAVYTAITRASERMDHITASKNLFSPN